MKNVTKQKKIDLAIGLLHGLRRRFELYSIGRECKNEDARQYADTQCKTGLEELARCVEIMQELIDECDT